MKIVRLVLWVLCLSPGLVSASVEFRFITDDSQGAKEYLHDRIDESYFLEEHAALGLDDLKTVNSGFSESGSPAISIEFTEVGQQRFAQVTSQAANKTLAMLLDNRVIARATIRGEINTPSVQLPLDASVREVAGYVMTINEALSERNLKKLQAQQATQARENILAERLNQESSEPGNSSVDLVGKAEDLAKGFFGKKLVALLFENWFFLIFALVFFMPLMKKIFGLLFTVAKSLAGLSGSDMGKKVTRALPLDFSKNRIEESARDKGQRLIGDGRYVEALRYLGPYVRQNPNDLQAVALLSNAREWSGYNERSSGKKRSTSNHSARRQQQSDQLRQRTTATSAVEQAKSSLKMNKEQALRMAQSIIKQQRK